MTTPTPGTTDQFNVTAQFDAPSYVTGQTITATISGSDVETVTTTSQGAVGPLTIPLVAADGAKSTVVLPAVPVTIVVQTPTTESVVIDAATPIVDNSATPRQWAVAANGLSITSVA